MFEGDSRSQDVQEGEVQEEKVWTCLPVDRMTNRLRQLKTLPSCNFVGCSKDSNFGDTIVHNNSLRCFTDALSLDKAIKI